MSMMEKVRETDQRVESAREKDAEEYQNYKKRLDDAESSLEKRYALLRSKKEVIAKKHGNEDVSGDDMLEINAGGKIVAVRRDKLCQLKGSRLEALFCGRWDGKLPKDSSGRFFLNVNPTCFRAIVDYLNELAISTPENMPEAPTVGEECNRILRQQLELFGLCKFVKVPPLHNNYPDSAIVIFSTEIPLLYQWLEEEGEYGDMKLLYRMTRDSVDIETYSNAFHNKCDKKGATITLIKTEEEGYVFGGYSNEPWTCEVSDPSTDFYRGADKAFIFQYYGSESPRKMKLCWANDPKAIYCQSESGPTFGSDMRLTIKYSRGKMGLRLHFTPGENYEASGIAAIEESGEEGFRVTEMEVFQVGGWYERACTDMEKTNKFTNDINRALNEKLQALQQADDEVNYLEREFAEEERLVEFLASSSGDDGKEIIELNVSGEIMTTCRSTLQTKANSVLARQFDELWTEKGCKSECIHVEKWVPVDVCNWAKFIDGIPTEVADTLASHGITGRELLALGRGGLEMLGITRPGTVCLLLSEIQKLRGESREAATLIEHSPSVFEKILDFLRWSELHAHEFAKEPIPYLVRKAEYSRFQRIVDYYFPGAKGPDSILWHCKALK